MHAKSETLKSFWYKKKGTCCSKKSKNVKVKKNEFKKKAIKKIKDQTKKGMKKGWKKHIYERRTQTMIFRKRFSVSNGRVFFFLKKVKKDTKLTLKKQEREMKGRSFQEENFLFLSDSKDQGKNIFRREK